MRSFIKRKLHSYGWVLRRSVTAKVVERFMSRFRENYVSIDLIRVGGSGDGSYLLPKNLQNVEYCFSPGVGVTANFEEHLAEDFGIKSFMADASVSALPTKNDLFEFDKKFLGVRDHGDYTTLESWVNAKVGKDARNMLLQMDIEGEEYGVLIESDKRTLARFQSIAIEFHFVESKLLDRSYWEMLTHLFEKLYKNFFVAHVHPNNENGFFSVRGIEIPPATEVTFIHKDMVSSCSSTSKIVLPHALDEKNVPEKPDLKMPEIWWKK